MMNIPKKSSGGGDDWMNTYADMVTLLMCFFVLLFSMSTIDSAKWEQIVKSFNPNADKVSQVVTGQVTPGEDDVGATGDTGDAKLEDIELLFQELKEYMAENNLDDDVKLFKGAGYIFITFKSRIFFDGDKAVLREESKPMLTFLSSGLKKTKQDIAEVKVYGHTNQASPDQLNDIDIDRDLSALRAARVVSFMQKLDCLEPKKIAGIGCGQWYPAASYDTAEDREKNRRVEILIAKNDTLQMTLDEIYAAMEESGIEAP